jgi:hypothetical protein
MITFEDGETIVDRSTSTTYTTNAYSDLSAHCVAIIQISINKILLWTDKR